MASRSEKTPMTGVVAGLFESDSVVPPTSTGVGPK